MFARRIFVSSCIAATRALVPAMLASAHADHTQGQLSIAVGFATEPAYAGQPNAMQLLVAAFGIAIASRRRTVTASA